MIAREIHDDGDDILEKLKSGSLGSKGTFLFYILTRLSVIPSC